MRPTGWVGRRTGQGIAETTGEEEEQIMGGGEDGLIKTGEPRGKLDSLGSWVEGHWKTRK